VQRVVEADGRDGGTGDRGQQGATQRVAERVAEARLERTDREPLLVVGFLAEGFDGGALHDEHVLPVLSWGVGRVVGRGVVDVLSRRGGAAAHAAADVKGYFE
jgi:hypothetical protein